MDVIRAVLVENLERPHRMYRRILERIEGVELADALRYPEELLERLDSGLKVDVIIMDVRMDDDLDKPLTEHIDGIEAARRLRIRFPRMPIVLYSMWENPEYYHRIEEARFSTRFAFVKRYSLDDWDRMGEIIRMVMRGQNYIDAEVRVEMDLLKERGERSPLRLLENDDQRKVLALMADGLSNEEIARAITRSVRWVEEAVKNIYQILDISGEGTSDSRRIRAVRMFQEDRVLRWERQFDGAIRLLAQDRRGEWRPLDEIERLEHEEKEDARIINNAAF